MTEAAFFEPKRLSPAGLGVVIAFHAGLITVAALSKIEVIRERVPPIIVDFIEDPTDPPPVDKAEPKTDPKIEKQTFIDKPDPVVDPPEFLTGSEIKIATGPVLPPLRGDFGIGTEPVKPPPDPIRIDARLDPRFGDTLKPPYPLDERRDGIEGSVTLRVLIGSDGRVKAVEKLAATTDGFFRAAERQALSRWRFRPATIDGRPIESRKVMTLRFELDAEA